jgi:signal transduction histidine kinase
MAAPPGARRSETSSLLLRAMSDAVLAVASEHAVEPVLQRLVHVARDLVDARFAALGIPDGPGKFERFLTSGMTDEQIARIGPLPRTHGLLGAMLSSPEPYRTPDIRADPRFWGWPREHPTMTSFLGVPIVARGAVIGAFYLTVKEGAEEFTGDDQELIEMLAAHAAVAIENARLYERSRELSVVEERNRLARDLHDVVVQTLFGVVLTADAAALLVDRDPEAAKAELERVREQAQEALRELRSLVFELRPADLEADGLAATLRKHVEVLGRVHALPIELEVEAEPALEAAAAVEVFRIAQEALNNAQRHASASAIAVRLSRGELAVADDGVGFDAAAPAVRGRRLGLTSMEERAAAIGGRLRIESTPGSGTTVTLELP